MRAEEEDDKKDDDDEKGNYVGVFCIRKEASGIYLKMADYAQKHVFTVYISYQHSYTECQYNSCVNRIL
jgi:hypothetical protein